MGWFTDCNSIRKSKSPNGYEGMAVSKVRITANFSNNSTRPSGKSVRDLAITSRGASALAIKIPGSKFSARNTSMALPVNVRGSKAPVASPRHERSISATARNRPLPIETSATSSTTRSTVTGKPLACSASCLTASPCVLRSPSLAMTGPLMNIANKNQTKTRIILLCIFKPTDRFTTSWLSMSKRR